MSTTSDSLERALGAALLPLATSDGSSSSDLEVILDQIGDARVVLIGEASHGTHEFYALRAAITRRLIETQGLRAVCIEGDWPDTRRIDRYVRGLGDDASAEEALRGFRRFPQWMWRNAVMRDFVEWLREHNDGRDATQQCGVFGLDLYSLHSSIAEVLRYLDEVDPSAAERARGRYSCFDFAGGSDPQAYGYATSRNLIESCEDDVVRQLAELRHCADEYLARDDSGDADFFSAEQNARLVANAERYYRAMFRGRASSWNLRDTHMAETLDAVLAHIGDGDDDARVCVWAHNSHLGDARATQMGRAGELNVGELVRQQYHEESCLIGLTTFDGTVTAARDWDEPAERRRVNRGLPGSVEALFHSIGEPNFVLDLRDPHVRSAFGAQRLLERAIGVIYRPETERQSHYFDVEIAKQFDIVVHLDRTRALAALEREGEAGGEAEVEETYPSGL